MKNETLKRETFREYLDLYSADFSLWPQDRVKQALALVEADSVARALFDEALALDTMMRLQDASAGGHAALEDKIMARIATTAQEKTAPVLPVTAPAIRPLLLFAPGGGLLAAAILGFFWGADMQVQTDYLLDPVYYSQDEIIDDDAGLTEEEVF